MDFLTRLSLKRPVSTMLVLVALIVFGISSILSFELERNPQINIPMISVSVMYEGADPETVDKLVARPIEELGQRVRGMTSVSTTLTTGSAYVVFSFDNKVEIEQTLLDVKAEIEGLNLPEGCGRPVARIARSINPFMDIQVSADDKDVLTYVNNTLKPSLERLADVAEVKVYGGKEEYIRVLLDERLMDQYSVTLDSIKQALASSEYSIPADTVRQGDMNIRVSATSGISSIAEVEEIPVQTAKGTVVTLRDLADISYSVRKADSISRHNGEENIDITITKNQIASTVTAARQVEAELDRLRDLNPEINIEITQNTADEIITSLKEVAMTLLIGVLLSMMTLFIFFGDLKASLIVGSSMPISLLATLILMALAGIQLDILSMGGLVISIGMMVDSSIVVLESCFRAQEEGLDFKESALKGTGEVTASIVASTITTVVVYAPIAVLGGLISKMFEGLCTTIIIAMLTSLVVSLTFIPLFFSFYKPVEKKNAPTVRIIEKISGRYGKLIRKIIPRKAAVLIVTLGMIGLTVLMLLSMNIDMNASADMGEFEVTVTCRGGTAMEVTDQKAKKYEEILIADPDIRDVNYSVENNVATIHAYIVKDKEIPSLQKVDEYNRMWSDEKGVDIVAKVVSDSSSDSKTEVKVNLTGSDYDALKAKVYAVAEALSDVEGVYHVSSQLESGATEARIKIDQKKAMDAGLNPQSVGALISNVSKGIEALKIKSSGEEYKVRIEYPKDRYDDLNKIMNLRLTGQGNKVVTLSDIAELKYEEAAEKITKKDGNYALAITATCAEEDQARIQQAADDILESMDLGDMEVGTDALTEMLNNELKKMIYAILASIFLVFLVMAMQFESPRFSAMVMMSIPFSFIGSIGLIFITGGTLTSDSMIGGLMLVGIVVNDGILFVDTSNGLLKKYPVNEALARSGELRMRPILMTTLTTVLSMVPLVLSKDTGASIMDGMGLIIIGGMMASTTLILILLPTFYILFMGKRAKLENYKLFPPEDQGPSKGRKAKRIEKKEKKEQTKEDKKEKKAEEKIREGSLEIEDLDAAVPDKESEGEGSSEEHVT